MEKSLASKVRNRGRRALRVRQKLKGSSMRPRLTVYKSNKHLHIQVIDDESGSTLASLSTLSKEFRGGEFGKKNKESGKQLGLAIGKQVLAKNVKQVIFDRGPFKYHGVIAAVADGAREAGLEV